MTVTMIFSGDLQLSSSHASTSTRRQCKPMVLLGVKKQVGQLGPGLEGLHWVLQKYGNPPSPPGSLTLTRPVGVIWSYPRRGRLRHVSDISWLDISIQSVSQGASVRGRSDVDIPRYLQMSGEYTLVLRSCPRLTL
jgi:hypothetical protein